MRQDAPVASEPNAAHEKVRLDFLGGKVIDFSTPDDPVDLPSADDDAYWAGRTIEAEWLTTFLRSPKSSTNRGFVFHIIGVRIDGIDLTSAEIPYALFF